MPTQSDKRPPLHGVIRDGLPKEVKCELIPKMWKEPSHMVSRRSRPGRRNIVCKGAEPGMVSVQWSPNGMQRLLAAPTSWGCCVDHRRWGNVCRMCLSSSQHSRNVDCYYDIQRLGFILGVLGGMGVLSHHLGDILGQLAWVPTISGHQKHMRAIIKKLLSQQLIISVRLPIHIIAALWHIASHDETIE